MKKLIFNLVLVCSFALVASSCRKDDDRLLEQSDTLNAKVSIDDILAKNPNISQIRLIGNGKDLTVITDEDNIASKTTVSYSLGVYGSIIVTRLTKSAVQGKTLSIAVTADNNSKNSCYDYEPKTLPIVEKVGWNSGNMTVLQSVQVNGYKSFYADFDSNGCNLTSKANKKQGTINQYDAGSYQEVGWKIRTTTYSTSFQVVIDVY